ncbi:MAG: hypothetical protein AAF267_23395 [Deinococcota bacterium]
MRTLQDAAMHPFPSTATQPKLVNLRSLDFFGNQVQLYPQTLGEPLVTDGLAFLASSQSGL